MNGLTMSAALQQLDLWLAATEDEHLECKEAKNRFDFEQLVKYCAALANERGGVMLLGVTNKPPRRVVGSEAFPDLERTKLGLVDRLHLRIDANIVNHPDGRVVVFQAPARPIGLPIQYLGAYWMRAGESLAPMTPDMLKRIFEETGPDFSGEVCLGATLNDLDPGAIETFREMWRRKSGNAALAGLSQEHLLADAELVSERGVTFAALILLGTYHALGRYLPQAEVVFEYRSSAASLPSQQRAEYRKGFLSFHDALWTLINSRNNLLSFQDGLFRGDLLAFNEAVVREAILNAVAHRDYRLGGSVFIRQFPFKLEIVSPGGFPAGVTPENILRRQAPRNRRVAEAFARCGLVERAGQGANRMYEETIKESKPPPDFSDSDAYQVSLTLRAEIEDPHFLNYLHRINQRTVEPLHTDDLLVLDFLRRGQPVPDELRGRFASLQDHGLIERQGRGPGARFVLSPRFYTRGGKARTPSEKQLRGRAAAKESLLDQIGAYGGNGVRLKELRDALPGVSERSVQRMLSELRQAGEVRSAGRGRTARWYPGQGAGGVRASRGH